MSPDDPRHGTYAGGRVHRRAGEPVCEPCRIAEARYENQRRLDVAHGRPRTTGSLPTRRRVQALVALGHTLTRIGEALDVTNAMAWALANRPTNYVRITTAVKVASLYDAWSMTLPPANTPLERRNATYARTVANRNGWAVPLAWNNIDTDLEPIGERDTTPAPDPRYDRDVDQAVVHRFLGGEYELPTTLGERQEIVRRWVLDGRPVNDLARLTGWKPERYSSRDEAAA